MPSGLWAERVRQDLHHDGHEGNTERARISLL